MFRPRERGWQAGCIWPELSPVEALGFRVWGLRGFGAWSLGVWGTGVLGGFWGLGELWHLGA